MSAPADAELAASERSALEAERDFLLRSLDDLDAEHHAGDLEDDQYEQLRAEYVRRTAEVARRLDGETVHDDDADFDDDDAVAAPGRTKRSRGGWALVGLGVFGVLAGLLLATSLGQRPDGGLATGSGKAPQDRGAECRGLSFSEPVRAVPCYDKLMVSAPDDPEFLTYRGWAKVRSDDPAGAMVDFDRVVAVDPEYPDVYAFRAVVAKDAGDFEQARAELGRLASLNPPATVTDTIEQMGLDVEVAEGLLAPAVRECWLQEKKAIGGVNAAIAAGSDPAGAGSAEAGTLSDSLTQLIRADQCLTAVLAATPDDTDALVMRGLAISILYQVSLAAEPDQSVLTRALQVLGRAVELDPSDPNARLIRAAVHNMAGDPESARVDLDAMGNRAVSPLYAIDASAIRADVEQSLATSPGGTGGP